MIEVSQFDSPLGRIAVAEKRGRVLSVCFGGRRALRSRHPLLWELDRVEDEAAPPAATALRKFLEGGTQRLRLPVDWALVSGPFDRVVLQRLYRLRAGQTVFYGELAAMVGRPGAARAVGGAMRRNPVPVVVPCHRVLPFSGGLGNYTGGVKKKRWLLARDGFKPE